MKIIKAIIAAYLAITLGLAVAVDFVLSVAYGVTVFVLALLCFLWPVALVMGVSRLFGA